MVGKNNKKKTTANNKGGSSASVITASDPESPSSVLNKEEAEVVAKALAIVKKIGDGAKKQSKSSSSTSGISPAPIVPDVIRSLSAATSDLIAAAASSSSGASAARQLSANEWPEPVSPILKNENNNNNKKQKSNANASFNSQQQVSATSNSSTRSSTNSKPIVNFENLRELGSQSLGMTTTPPPHAHPSLSMHPKHHNRNSSNKGKSASGEEVEALSMSFSGRVMTQTAKTTRRLIKPKRNWVIFTLLGIIIALVWHQSHEIMPAGLIVDDPTRPGVLFDKSKIKMRRPVVMIPGFITSALEVWENDDCFTPIITPPSSSSSSSGGGSSSFFRERMFGPQMILNLLKRPQCYMRQFSLSQTDFGADPEPLNKSSGRNKIRVRPAGWLDSGDYFITGYWVWAKLIRNLADIGYEPNNMMLFPFDWRLSGALAERRDGYFHRLRASVEEMFRIGGEIKVVFVSHSYGGNINHAFFHWIEAREPGWTNKHVHSMVTIGAPMLGLSKAVSAVLSGEMRDMTNLPAIARHILNAHIPRMWRTEAFRSWPCLEAMLPRGCDAMWPNVVSLFNQSVSLRASDVYAVLDTVATQAGHNSFASKIKDSKETITKLPNLPKAPDLKVFTFYGTGLATEIGYAYTLDEGDVGGADAARTANKGSLMLGSADVLQLMDTLQAHFGALWGWMGRVASNAFIASSSSASGTAEKGSASSSTSSSKPHLYSAPQIPEASSAPQDGASAVSTAEVNETPRDAALLNWSQYLLSLGELVKDMGGRVVDEARKQMGGKGKEEERPEAQATNKAGESEDTAKSIEVQQKPRPHSLQNEADADRVPPGALWREEFLGTRTSGNAFMVDTDISDKVNPSIAVRFRHSEERVKGGGDLQYHQGVLLGAGDATVPLISLGFMSRSPAGWRRDVGQIVTKEFVHLHTAEAHEKLLAIKKERLRRKALNKKEAGGGLGGESGEGQAKKKKTIPNIGITTASFAAEAVLPSDRGEDDDRSQSRGNNGSGSGGGGGGDDSLNNFDAYLSKLLALNMTRLLEVGTSELEEVVGGAANSLYSATDELVEQVKEGVKTVLDVRGGKASADHVDLMGNYELIEDFMNIVTGNEHLVEERIFTDIDQRVKGLPCYREDEEDTV